VPFVNQHKKTGLIVTPGNIDELTQAMDVLWNNDNLRSTYGNNAKKRCMDLFTKKQMISKTMACLHSMIKKKDD
jgi:glycosyltransferase involved in cell wall biosynthesis